MSEENMLPKGWVSARLQDVVRPEGTRNPHESGQDEFFYVDIEAVDNTRQKIVAPKRLLTADAPSRARVAIQANDVMFSLVRPYLKNIAIVPSELDGQIASTAYCVMRPETGIVSPFVFYALLRDSFINSIKMYGNSPPSGHDDEFLSMSIPVAPTIEQKRIVAALEQHFTRLDAVVATLKQNQAKIKRAYASVLKAAVEGNLTEVWRIEHPVTKSASELLKHILGERCAKWEANQLAKMQARGVMPKDDKWKEAYKEPVSPYMKELPELPDGWCWGTVNQMTSRSEYGTSVKCDYAGEGVPVLRIPNIVAGEIDLRDMKYSLQPLKLDEEDALQPGDILVCRTNGSIRLIGKAALVRTQLEPYHTFASYLLRFRLFEANILPRWFHLFLSSPQGRYFIESNAPSSAGQHNISLTILHSMNFPLPPLAEQEQIIAEVEQRLSIISQLETAIETSLRRAERFRQSLLREAFMGRLVPQDPTDEPASILLERIQEKRKLLEQAEQKRRKEERKVNPQSAEKKKTAKQRTPLVQVLIEAKTPLPSDVLFRRAGLQVDEVDEFYQELRNAVGNGYIKEVRPDATRVLLEAISE